MVRRYTVNSYKKLNEGEKEEVGMIPTLGSGAASKRYNLCGL